MLFVVLCLKFLFMYLCKEKLLSYAEVHMIRQQWQLIIQSGKKSPTATSDV